MVRHWVCIWSTCSFWHIFDISAILVHAGVFSPLCYRKCIWEASQTGVIDFSFPHFFLARYLLENSAVSSASSPSSRMQSSLKQWTQNNPTCHWFAFVCFFEQLWEFRYTGTIETWSGKKTGAVLPGQTTDTGGVSDTPVILSCWRMCFLLLWRVILPAVPRDRHPRIAWQMHTCFCIVFLVGS